MRKILKLILLFFFVATACAGRMEKDEFRVLEMQDHEECLSVGANPVPEIAIELYWRCRKEVIEERIEETMSLTGKGAYYNSEFKKIRKILKNRVIQAQNANTARLSGDINEIEHQICILKYASEKKMTKEYNECRQQLIFNRTPPEPFAIDSYKITAQDMDNPEVLEQIINNDIAMKQKNLTINEQAEITVRLIELFPKCGEFNVKSEKFHNCIKIQNEIKKCENEIPLKLERRKLQDRMFCEKEAVKEFPDELSIYIEKPKETATVKEQPKQEEKKEKKGTDLSQLLGFGKKEEAEAKLEEKPELKTEPAKPVVPVTYEMGPKLSKGEIMELRDNFYNKCLKERRKKFREYETFLPSECGVTTETQIVIEEDLN